MVVLFFILVILVGGFLAWAIFSPNAVKVKAQTYLYIPNGAVYGAVLDSLEEHEMLAHPQNFREISKLLDYPTHVYAGRYKVSPGMSNFDLIKLLRSGKQSPVR
ncbi:MAG TPA: endolytic transglycosylase MltG, partial [Chitinophagaceae bacterium]|nr:endolytic transglycosylase MltG [Chitinophagaceae bacterium]